MNDILRERLIRKLESLSEDRIYQILDYIDFLESNTRRSPRLRRTRSSASPRESKTRSEPGKCLPV